MAYVVPQTVSTGCLISAASWNQNVVNNILQIVASPLSISFTTDRVGVNSTSPATPLEVRPFNGEGGTVRLWSASTNNTAQVQLSGASSNAVLFVVGTDVTTFNGQKSFDIYDQFNTTARYHISASGAHVINSGTCNTFNTQGLTIQQGAATDEGITLKNSTITHGMTTRAETDTYGVLKNPTGTDGALAIYGFSGSTAGDNPGLSLYGNQGKAADTTKSNAAYGVIALQSFVKSGTGITVVASTGNLLVIRNSSSARFIFQGGGDLFADSGLSASAFDTHDDVSLVRALELERQPGSVVRDVFDSWIQYNRRDLEAADIATFNDGPGEDGSVFVNVTGLQRLHSGALVQITKHIMRLEQLLVDKGILEKLPDRTAGHWLAQGPPKEPHVDTG